MTDQETEKREKRRAYYQLQRLSPEFRRRAADATKRYFRRHPERRKRRDDLKYFYGLTKEDYNWLLAKQHGLCAICRHPPTARLLAVDHDHSSLLIRGLLCLNCNAVLGQARDNPLVLARALQYLTKDRSNEEKTFYATGKKKTQKKKAA